MQFTVYNPFHDVSVTFRVRSDGTISYRTRQRVVNELCPDPNCRCLTSADSGPDVEWVLSFEKVFERGHIVAFTVTRPHPIGILTIA
jgi:hypothetical protein